MSATALARRLKLYLPAELPKLDGNLVDAPQRGHDVIGEVPVDDGDGKARLIQQQIKHAVFSQGINGGSGEPLRGD